jgi:pimeloyl-ACP methyl ester carboxylesterase
MADIVLVHGGQLGGWAWRPVASRLSAQRHNVFRPSLTGQGDRSHVVEGVTLHTHIDDIVNLIRWEDLNEVVLCGHSYGGMIVTGVAERIADRIGALIYLDALVPRDGDTALSARFAVPATGEALPNTAYHATEADKQYITGKLTPMPPGCIEDPLALTGAYRSVQPKLYIRATRYASRTLDHFYEQALGESDWTTRKVAAGHMAMIEAPDEVAMLFAEVADSVDLRASSRSESRVP